MRRSHILAAAVAVAVSCGASIAARAQDVPPGAIFRIDAGVHSGVVRRIALSADQRTMVTSSFDKTIRVWNLPEGTLRSTFRVPAGDGFEGSGYAVALSPDGRTIAVGGWMKQMYVYLLDSGTGAVTGVLGPNPDIVNHVAFSPDGARIAAVFGNRNGVRLWDVAGRALLAEDSAYGRDTYVVDFAQDGSFVTGGYDGILRYYGADGVRQAGVPARSGTEIDDIDISPDGKRMAVSYSDRTGVDIYDTATRTWLISPELAAQGVGGISSVAWSSNGSHLYVGGQMKDKDGYYPTLRMPADISAAPSVVLRTIDTVSDLEPYGAEDFAFSTTSPQLGIVRAENFVMNVETNTAAMGSVGVSGIRASADGRRILFASDYAGKQRYVFDVDALSLTPVAADDTSLAEPDISGLDLKALVSTYTPSFNGVSLAFDSGEWAMTVAAYPDRQRIILGSGWYVRNYDSAGTMQWRTAVAGWSWGVTTTRDGSAVIGAFGDGTIRWFRASDGAVLLSLFITRDAKRWIAWTPGGYYAASPEGETLAGWQVDKADQETPDYFPIAAFRAQFNKPAVLKAILRTLDEGKAAQEAQVN